MAINIGELRRVLSEIESIYQQANIVERPTMLLLTGDFLTQGHINMERLSNIGSERTRSMINEGRLREAIDYGIKITSNAQVKSTESLFFDYCISYFFDDNAAQGVYPTPPHVVDFLVDLAEVESEDRILELACGTGRILNQASQTSKFGSRGPLLRKSVGIDQNFVLIEVARVQNRLRENSAEFRVEDVVKWSLQEPSSIYDQIFCDPPIGSKVATGAFDAELVQRDIRPGSKAEELYIQLALYHLAPGGKISILVSHRFFGNLRSASLRRRLLEECHIEAIVEFNRQAFSPFFVRRAFLLKLRKRAPLSNYLTWFFRVERDGLEKNKSARRLPNFDAHNDPLASDFPNILAVWHRRSEKGILEPETHLHIKVCESTGPNPQGLKSYTFVIEATEGHRLEQVRLITSPPARTKNPNPGRRAFLLVKVTGLDNYCRIFLDERNLMASGELVNDLKLLLQKQVAGWKPENPIPGTVLVTEDMKVSGAAISLSGKLLGVSVTKQDLVKDEVDLDPERFFSTQTLPEDQPQEVISPAVLLNQVLQSQQSVSRRIDSLLGRLDFRIARIDLPPQLLLNYVKSGASKAVEPFGELSAEQKDVWGQIDTLTQHSASSKAFLVQQLIPPKKETLGDTLGGQPGVTLVWSEDLFTRDEDDLIQKTLQLFEAMGLIVPVSYRDDEGRILLAYRRVTVKDAWDLETTETP